MSEQDLTTPRFQHKRALVVGLGKTGLSCARFLAERGVEIAVTDSRLEPPCLNELQTLLPDAAVFVGGFNAEAFTRADCLVVSPGVSLREPLIAEARARGATILGDIELFAQFADAPVIAITGSNGKSTVTTLVGLIAEQAGRNAGVGGNIGKPALELLGQGHDLYVLELSSFQLETTGSLDACAAALLNISEDHMDRYNSLSDYAAAKAKIFNGRGSMVVNADDKRVMKIAGLAARGRQLTAFSVEEPLTEGFSVCEINNEACLCHGGKKLLGMSELKIKGKHNTANALAAAALAYVSGLSVTDIQSALRDFTGLPHRCQWVAEQQGINWFNDSKATNVGATVAAIKGVPAEKIVLIAGGQGKDQDFAPLKQVVAEYVRAIVLLGEDADKLEKAIADSVPVLHAQSMQLAVNLAGKQARAGDAVLMSPACASFDMFSGFAQRGEVFSNAVREYLA